MLRTSMKLTVAALVSGLAVAACGPVEMGAAAIVGGQRISSSSLSAEVASLNATYQANRSEIQLQYPASQTPQRVLTWLVKFQVQDRLAMREGVTVTPSEVAQGLAVIANQNRQPDGSTVPLQVIAVANGIPPDQVTELGRYQAIQTKVLNRLDDGKLPTTEAAVQALVNRFDTAECRAAKSLDIQINPQFGVLDYSQFLVIPATSTLSRSQSPPPTSRPMLAPPCSSRRGTDDTR